VSAKVSATYLFRAAVIANSFVQKKNVSSLNAPAAEQGVPRFLVPPGTEPALAPAPIPVLQLATTALRFGLRPDGSNPPQPRPQIAYANSVADTWSAPGRNSSSGQAGRPKRPIQIDPSLLPPASQVQKPVGASSNTRTASHVLGPITRENAENEQATNADGDDDDSNDDDKESKASDGDDEDDGGGGNLDEDANDGRSHNPNTNCDGNKFDGNDDYENSGEESMFQDPALGHYPMGVDIGIVNTVCPCLHIS
jgi:hypothetical protein